MFEKYTIYIMERYEKIKYNKESLTKTSYVLVCTSRTIYIC